VDAEDEVVTLDRNPVLRGLLRSATGDRREDERAGVEKERGPRKQAAHVPPVVERKSVPSWTFANPAGTGMAQLCGVRRTESRSTEVLSPRSRRGGFAASSTAARGAISAPVTFLPSTSTRTLIPGSMRSGSVRSRSSVTMNERRHDFWDGSR